MSGEKGFDVLVEAASKHDIPTESCTAWFELGRRMGYLQGRLSKGSDQDEKAPQGTPAPTDRPVEEPGLVNEGTVLRDHSIEKYYIVAWAGGNHISGGQWVVLRELP